MSDSDPDSNHIREVYARFGLAIYFVQCVEHAIAIVLSTEYGLGVRKMTRAEYDVLVGSLFKLTFGDLLKKLRAATDVPDDFDARLKEALTTRNWLVHHYFWERAGRFVTVSGREAMLAELDAIRVRLEELDEYFGRISSAWAARHGVTAADIEACMHRLARDSEP